MKSVRIAIDGASRGNPGAAGIGVVVYSESGEVIKEIGEYIGHTTNNIAEYKALIRGLEEAVRLGAKQVRVQTDSELLARQVSGIYKVRATHLLPLYFRVKELFSKFPEARIVHVRRELNAHADRLASDAARRRADQREPGQKADTSRKGSKTVKSRTSARKRVPESAISDKQEIKTSEKNQLTIDWYDE